MEKNKTKSIEGTQNNSDIQYFAKRFTAYYIDSFIQTIGMFLLIIPGLGYGCLKDALFDGRSIGKKIIGLQVVSYESGKACDYKESILRNIIFFTPLAWIEWIMVLLQSEKRRLGDLLANTKVVDDGEFDTKRIVLIFIALTLIWIITFMLIFFIISILMMGSIASQSHVTPY